MVIDDNSNIKDRSNLYNLIQNINIKNLIIYKNEFKTLCTSFNLAFDICKTQYLFTLEDDWIFYHENHFIQNALEIFKKHNYVKKVIPDLSTSGKEESFFNPKDSYITEYGVEYIIDEYREKNLGHWPSYSDRTGIINRDACLTKVGYYNPTPKYSHDNSRPTTETDYAIRFCDAGFKTAYFKKSLMSEISSNHQSAFNLNNISRHI
jgi:hypothetical protein